MARSYCSLEILPLFTFQSNSFFEGHPPFFFFGWPKDGNWHFAHFRSLLLADASMGLFLLPAKAAMLCCPLYHPHPSTCLTSFHLHKLLYDKMHYLPARDGSPRRCSACSACRACYSRCRDRHGVWINRMALHLMALDHLAPRNWFSDWLCAASIIRMH